MNVCFETFGCRLNRAEALESEAKCLALGHRVVQKHADADLIMIRGCSVTSRAQRDCEKMVAHLRRHYPNKRLVVTGCLPGAQKAFEWPSAMGATADTAAAVPTRTARAYLKVQDGCAGACSFCIVPKFRGTSVSEPFDATLAKAARFIAVGYRELVVTGCNLTLYASEGRRLPDLVAALAELDPVCRIRLGSIEPWGCATEVVDAMAEHANVCRQLHLPVQSGSDRILQQMNRPYRAEDAVRLIARARGPMPTVAIGCDLMTGFPGETDIDFAQTRTFVSRQTLASAHVFPFSSRPGTAAASLPGDVARDVRAARARTLIDLVRASRKRFARKFLGKTVEVVIESHGVQAKGWTSEHLWFEGPAKTTHPETAATHMRKRLRRFIVRTIDGDVLHGVPTDDGW